MTRLWFRPSAAEFSIGLGAQAEMLDAASASFDPQQFGRAALVPLAAQTYLVYTAPDAGSQTTDLLDEIGDPITSWVTSTDFASLGVGPPFQGPDEHEGDLFLSADATVFYRVTPSTNTLFTRLGTAEGTLAGLETTDLIDISDTPATDGQILVRNNTLGVYEPQDPGSGSGEVSTVASVSPDGTGNVTTAALLSALGLTSTAADMNVLKARGYIGLAYTGSGYEAKPSGFTLAIRRGPQEPTSNLSVGDIWLQPQSSGS